MKMDKGEEASVYFARPRGTMAEQSSIKFEVFGDGQWHVYEIDMSANSRWRGKIGQIRIDPNAVAGSMVEMSYVKFR
jgi:hypothetical protein